MRDCLFLVADKNMSYSLKGVLGRPQFHRVLGTAPFRFEPERDIQIAHGQNDPGLYKRADELLRPLVGKWQHAVVMADASWDGSPGADAIRERLESHLERMGWSDGSGLGLVLVPEVDIWLWSESPHTPEALGWPSWTELRPVLEGRFLEPGQVKPAKPKEAAEFALRLKKGTRTSEIYREVSSKVSLAKCQETSVLTLIQTLQRWFPPGGAE